MTRPVETSRISEIGAPGTLRKLAASVRLGVPFYLGLFAPCARQSFRHCRVRAAVGFPPDLVARLIALYRGESNYPGAVDRINFRCAKITSAASGPVFFVKEFPKTRAVHELERRMRCSRVDRAWRAGHLLPRLGLLTPRAIGTAQLTGGGTVTEYLVTEWLEAARPFPEVLADSRGDERVALLGELVRHMALWHARGLYLRDLVKNVLVTEIDAGRQYWLTDLDAVHPIRWPSWRRVLHQMRQISHWAKPISREQAELIGRGYLGLQEGRHGSAALEALIQALQSAN